MSFYIQIERRIAAFIERKQNEVDENNRQEFCSVFPSVEGIQYINSSVCNIPHSTKNDNLYKLQY